MTARPTPSGVSAIERRFCFAAWPQAYAHSSWFERLEARLGMPVSRDSSRAAAGAEQAVALALLSEAGAGGTRPGVAIDALPDWLLEHGQVQRRLSTAGALNLLPELMRAVSGETVRHWDAVLGPGVRLAALRLGSSRPPSSASAASLTVRQFALLAARTTAEWTRFCLCLGLTGLTALGAAVQARLRLAWPDALRDAQPWPGDEATLRWVDACLASAEQATFEDQP
jgi:hypothetical protein